MQDPWGGHTPQLPPCTLWPPQNRGHTKDLVPPGHCHSLDYEKISLASLAPVASLGGGGHRRDEAWQTLCLSQQCSPAREPGKEEMRKALCDQDASGIFISFSDYCRGLAITYADLIVISWMITSHRKCLFAFLLIKLHLICNQI